MTPEEHAAAVVRTPGPITVVSIAGAIRAYAEEIKGSQISSTDSKPSPRTITFPPGTTLTMAADLSRTITLGTDAKGPAELLAEVTAERDAERAARRALEQYVRSATPDLQEATRMRDAALALADKLP